jgi:hypothetical protein
VSGWNCYKEKQVIDVREEKKFLFPEKVWVAGCVNADLFPILISVAWGTTSLAPVIQRVAIAPTLIHIKNFDFANPAVI